MKRRCKFCKKKTEHKIVWKQHIQNNHSLVKFRCLVCKKYYTKMVDGESYENL